MRIILSKIKLRILCSGVSILLILNKILIKIVPFKKLITFYANTSYPMPWGEIEKKKARIIHNAINRHEKILFWKPVCFEKALTAMVLARLFHLPATVYFGIMKTEQGTMLAHAWSQIGEYWITGYENKDGFTVVYTMYYAPAKTGRTRWNRN